MDNPFVTKGYAGPEYFCDRVVETKQLVELTTNGNNMALISPRRVGKTDLIFHCFQQPFVVCLTKTLLRRKKTPIWCMILFLHFGCRIGISSSLGIPC